jgi:translocation and assembly module TamB
MRRLTKILAVFAIIVVVALFAIILLLATENGSRWLFQYGSDRFPGQLEIGRIQGTMLSGLSLHSIDYRINGQYVQIERFEIDWQLVALLAGTLHIETLYLKGVIYETSLAPETALQSLKRLPTHISFPLELKLDAANLEHFVFRRGDTEQVLDRARLAVKVDKDRFLVQRFEAKKDNLHLYLEGHAKLGNPYPFQAILKWRARLNKDVRARAVCSLKGDISTIKFSHQLSEPFILKTAGEIDFQFLTESDSVKIRQKVRQLRTAQTENWNKHEQQSSRRGTVSYQLTCRGNTRGSHLPAMQILARGIGNGTDFELEKLELNSLGGSIKVKGHINLQPELRWLFTVSGSNIDPGIHWPQWSGKLTLNAQVQGDFDSGTPIILLNKLRINGHMLEQPFQMAGDLSLRDRQLTLKNLIIHSGKNRFNLDGTVDAHSNLLFNVDAPDPGSLWPGFKGYVKAKGNLSGTRGDVSGMIALEGQDLRYGYYFAQNLDAYFALSSNDKSPSQARINFVNLLAGEKAFSNLSVTWAGVFKNHKIYVDVESTSATASIELAGSLYQDKWKVNVNSASFNFDKHGVWRLIVPLNILMSHTEIKPFKVCWLQENSSLCVQASWNRSNGWWAEGDLDAPPLEKMIDLLGEFFKNENLGWEKKLK